MHNGKNQWTSKRITLIAGNVVPASKFPPHSLRKIFCGKACFYVNFKFLLMCLWFSIKKHVFIEKLKFFRRLGRKLRASGI